jgi:hypothetical protein
MTAAILAALVPFIGALAPVLAQWILRRWTAQADPKNQIAQQKNENAQAVASDDPAAINRVLDERINRVQDEVRPAQQDADSAR